MLESESFKKYEDVIKAIPKMPEDKILLLIAHLKLELRLRERYYGSNK